MMPRGRGDRFLRVSSLVLLAAGCGAPSWRSSPRAPAAARSDEEVIEEEYFVEFPPSDATLSPAPRARLLTWAHARGGAFSIDCGVSAHTSRALARARMITTREILMTMSPAPRRVELGGEWVTHGPKGPMADAAVGCTVHTMRGERVP